jgi:hypothetical protein
MQDNRDRLENPLFAIYYADDNRLDASRVFDTLVDAREHLDDVLAENADALIVPFGFKDVDVIAVQGLEAGDHVPGIGEYIDATLDMSRLYGGMAFRFEHMNYSVILQVGGEDVQLWKKYAMSTDGLLRTDAAALEAAIECAKERNARFENVQYIVRGNRESNLYWRDTYGKFWFCRSETQREPLPGVILWPSETE